MMRTCLKEILGPQNHADATSHRQVRQRQWPVSCQEAAREMRDIQYLKGISSGVRRSG